MWNEYVTCPKPGRRVSKQYLQLCLLQRTCKAEMKSCVQQKRWQRWSPWTGKGRMTTSPWGTFYTVADTVTQHGSGGKMCSRGELGMDQLLLPYYLHGNSTNSNMVMRYATARFVVIEEQSGMFLQFYILTLMHRFGRFWLPGKSGIFVLYYHIQPINDMRFYDWLSWQYSANTPPFLAERYYYSLSYN